MAVFLFTILFIATYAIPALAGSQNYPKISFTQVKRISARAAQAPQAPQIQQGPPYATRDDAMQLADDIAARRDLDRDWVRQAIGQARYLPIVAKFITLPPTGTV